MSYNVGVGIYTHDSNWGCLRMKKRKLNGFTLIELIVVIAIIGVLAAILIPTMLGYVKKAKRASDVASAREIHTNVLDLILENEDAEDSFHDNSASTYSSPIQKTDAISNSNYDLVLVAYLDGRSSADGSGRVWKEFDSSQQEFCDMLNKRLDYAAGSTDIKMKIKSNASGGDNYNRWFVGYRKNTPSTIEVWVGDGSAGVGGDPQLCLYTQINNSTTSSDG